ncbi:MAG TPA: energy transducer TonB [Rhodocyclaceae bacterium]|nr:energy transducer TonB [Rhodocyclaceae bacterium]
MKPSQPIAFALASFVQFGMFYGLYLGLSHTHTLTMPPSLSVITAELISAPQREATEPAPTPPKVKPVVQRVLQPVSKPQPLIVPAAAPTPSDTAPSAVVTPQATPAAAVPINDSPQEAKTSPQPSPTPPRFDADYLNNPAPIYPTKSKQLDEQGRVLVRVSVNAKGIPDEIRLYKSSGFARLDEAAVKTVAQWRFVPARRGGEPVADWVIVPVDFQLN